MKKRKLKLKNLIIFSMILLLLILILLIIFHKPNNKLEELGYNQLEITEIEKLSDEELNTILKYNYNSNLIYVIKSENYKSDLLDLYLKYTLEYEDIDYLKIFELINNENFKEENINDYTTLLRKYSNIEAIIKYVNNYKDKNINIDETTLSFINEQYFIIDYLDRYLNYYDNNKNLEFKEIITRVNSNLDYTFYSDSNEVDLSKGMHSLVNKYNYLSQDYVPENLVTIEGKYARDKAQLIDIAFDNFVKMSDAASLEGLTLKITTGYRSYNFQSTLYNNYVKADGIKNADTYSARPGYSEHQLGYSADLTNADLVSFDDFENTKEYEWLKENAYKYGFIERYPKNKEYITGYIFESWHYRYVGVDIATYIYENDITYEEYYAYFLR